MVLCKGITLFVLFSFSFSILHPKSLYFTLHEHKNMLIGIYMLLTSRKATISLSRCSSRFSKWCACISASARRHVSSWSSSLDLLDGPLLCSISSSFLTESSRATSVCRCVSSRSSISWMVRRSRTSSRACLSCSSPGSSASGSPGGWSSWFRSRWMRNSAWSACTVVCRCCHGSDRRTKMMNN